MSYTIYALVITVCVGIHVSAQDMKPLSSLLSKSISSSGRKTVAVLDFTDLQGNVTELGRYLAEELSVDLVGDAKGFEVIERNQLKVILQEHRLSATGLIDPQTARKLGQLAGVDALVTGTITAFGDSVRLSAKVLDTQTAKMIGAAAADIPKTKAIEELLSRGISPGSGSTSETSSLSKPAPGPVSPSSVSVENNRLLFVIRKCSRSDRTVECLGSITNKAAEKREVVIDARGVYATDELGSPYRKGEIMLGAQGWQQEIEPGLEMALTLRVEDVEPRASILNFVIPYGYFETKPNQPYTTHTRSTVAVRNVPVQ
jgi:TolB-like protein